MTQKETIEKLGKDLKDQRKQKVVADLREALRTVNVGYPYFNVPLAIKNAIKFLKQ